MVLDAWNDLSYAEGVLFSLWLFILYYGKVWIDNKFRDARRIAWASIMNETDIKEEVEKQRKQKIKRQLKTEETANLLVPGR